MQRKDRKGYPLGFRFSLAFPSTQAAKCNFQRSQTDSREYLQKGEAVSSARAQMEWQQRWDITAGLGMIMEQEEENENL